MKITWLDKTITWASPHAGAKRMASRALASQVEQAVRAFDGASTGRRMKNWRSSNSSANTENRAALHTLRNRSRDLVRNEAYAAGAVDAVVNNTIGAGIMAHAVAKTAGRADKFDQLWLDWAESTDCSADGQHNFYGIQALAMRHVFTDGEVLIRKVQRPSIFKIAVPIQLQILEADFIDTYKDNEKLDDGGFIVQGVEFDSYGRRRAYWLFDRHPGDSGVVTMQGISSRKVPAEDVMHLFITDRAGQVRGIPRFAPIMVRMRDYSDFSDATLHRQKIAACFTAFVKQTESQSAVAALTTPTANGSTSRALGESMEPGMIEVLAEGQDITFANPPTTGDFSQFTKEQLRAMARGCGLSYEVFTGDYSQVNFSSGRMGWIEFSRQVDRWRWHLMIPQLCIPTHRWFTEAAVLKGMGTDPVGSRWTPPAREMLDPVKETDAAQRLVRAGFKSASQVIREMGYDPKEVREEMAADNALYDELGLILDSDPRKTNEFGAPYDLNAQKNGQAAEDAADEDDPAEQQNQAVVAPKEEPALPRERYFQDQEGSLFKVTDDGIEKIS